MTRGIHSCFLPTYLYSGTTGARANPSMHLAEGRETPWTGCQANRLTFIPVGNLESPSPPELHIFGLFEEI